MLNKSVMLKLFVCHCGSLRFSSLFLFHVRFGMESVMLNNYACRSQEEEVDPGDIPGTDLRVLKYPHPQLRAADEEITTFDDDLKKVFDHFCSFGSTR
jgi:hypothetical protein